MSVSLIKNRAPTCLYCLHFNKCQMMCKVRDCFDIDPSLCCSVEVVKALHSSLPESSKKEILSLINDMNNIVKEFVKEAQNGC